MLVGADTLKLGTDELVKGVTVAPNEVDTELLSGRTMGVTIGVPVGPEVLLIGYKVIS